MDLRFSFHTLGFSACTRWLRYSKDVAAHTAIVFTSSDDGSPGFLFQAASTDDFQIIIDHELNYVSLPEFRSHDAFLQHAGSRCGHAGDYHVALTEAAKEVYPKRLPLPSEQSLAEYVALRAALTEMSDASDEEVDDNATTVAPTPHPRGTLQSVRDGGNERSRPQPARRDGLSTPSAGHAQTPLADTLRSALRPDSVAALGKHSIPPVTRTFDQMLSNWEQRTQGASVAARHSITSYQAARLLRIPPGFEDPELVTPERHCQMAAFQKIWATKQSRFRGRLAPPQAGETWLRSIAAQQTSFGNWLLDAAVLDTWHAQFHAGAVVGSVPATEAAQLFVAPPQKEHPLHDIIFQRELFRSFVDASTRHWHAFDNALRPFVSLPAIGPVVATAASQMSATFSALERTAERAAPGETFTKRAAFIAFYLCATLVPIVPPTGTDFETFVQPFLKSAPRRRTSKGRSTSKPQPQPQQQQQSSPSLN